MRQTELRKLEMPERVKERFHVSHRQAAVRAGLPLNTYLRAIDPSNGVSPSLETVARIVEASGGFLSYEDFLDPDAKRALRKVKNSFLLGPIPRRRSRRRA